MEYLKKKITKLKTVKIFFADILEITWSSEDNCDTQVSFVYRTKDRWCVSEGLEIIATYPLFLDPKFG